MNSSNSTLGLVLAVALSGAAAAQESTYHVDAIHGDDVGGDGSAAAPWKTISRAHQEPLQSGDVVSVAPGVHNAALGEVFPITLKQGVKVVGAGPKRTIVRGGGDELLFEAGTGQTWFWLADLTLARAGVGAEHAAHAGSDSYLILERVLFESNQIGLHAADQVGNYSQTALLNCFFRSNATAVLAEENWSGFGETWLYVYGTTFVDNGDALHGTSLFGAFTRFVMKSSIVKDNGDDLFLGEFTVVSQVEDCLLSEPSLVGVNGNTGASPGFVHPDGGDPHLGTSSAAIDRADATSVWPPGPLPPSWWGGIPWHDSFEVVPDIDGHLRAGPPYDAGCDELELPSFHVWGVSSIGSSVDLVALGGASEVVHVYLSTGSSFSIPTPFGDWQLDFPWYSFLPLALDGSGEHVSSLAWPSDPTLVGIDVYFQAFTLPTLALTEVERVRFLP